MGDLIVVQVEMNVDNANEALESRIFVYVTKQNKYQQQQRIREDVYGACTNIYYNWRDRRLCTIIITCTTCTVQWMFIYSQHNHLLLLASLLAINFYLLMKITNRWYLRTGDVSVALVALTVESILIRLVDNNTEGYIPTCQLSVIHM